MNVEAELSELLAQWHQWQTGYTLGHGYLADAAGCEDWRASRQYDDQNGALDAVLEKQTLETLDFEVWQIPDSPKPLRTALFVNARALALRLSVFRSPRLPEDQVDCLALISVARDELARRLKLRGVISDAQAA